MKGNFSWVNQKKEIYITKKRKKKKKKIKQSYNSLQEVNKKKVSSSLEKLKKKE